MKSKSLQTHPETLIESDPAIKQEFNKNPEPQKRKNTNRKKKEKKEEEEEASLLGLNQKTKWV